MRRGTSIRIFLADGAPDGLRIVEKSNWTGRAIVCSRSQFSEVKRRSEFVKTGVYILLGNDNDQNPMAYIGEGDPILSRLEQHDRKKDFWNLLVAFTNKDDNLNKAHIQYLEARLVSLAKDANRSSLDNENIPALPALSEADVADMESYLDDMRLTLSTLGIKIFDVPVVKGLEGEVPSLLQIRSGNIPIAFGVDAPEGFLVKKDSRCLAKEVPSFPEFARNQRLMLLKRGALVNEGDYLVFTQDYVFNSPSQAAFTVLGRSANGRTEWRTATGITLKELQEERND